MRRFIGHDGGTTAIEFALVFPAFAALVFMTLEIGMVVYGKSMADRAARAAANELRVTAGLSDVQLRAKVCEMASPVLSCDDHLTVSKDAVCTRTVIA
jgi:Flp pilus assembly protein TadG